MTGSAPRKKVIRLRLCRGVDPFGAANPLDDVPQRHVDEVPVQVASAYTARHGYFAYLTQQAGAESERRADHALRKGQEVLS